MRQGRKVHFLGVFATCAFSCADFCFDFGFRYGVEGNGGFFYFSR